MLGRFAPAKVNLFLHVTDKRADGYHVLDSLAVFPAVGDVVGARAAEDLSLKISGRFGAVLQAEPDNLLLRAARALRPEAGVALSLEKNLPVASGIGGGSADAAAALRLLMRVNGIARDNPNLMAAARATGADVPVCLDPRPRVMRGVGDILSAPLDLPALPAVLVNPRVPVPTRDVFGKLGLALGERRGAASEIDPGRLKDRDALVRYLESQPNDLEPPARALQPVISDVLAALAACDGSLFARMSGSGATCFGLFASEAAAATAAQRLSATYPAWWIAPTVFAS